MKIDEIMQLLSHRYPFLLVDRGEAIEPFKRSRGYKNVTINEPFFVGHFPDEPVMPGVLIIESMVQVGALMFPRTKRGYLVQVDQVRFREKVVPGDRLETEAEFIAKVGNLLRVKCVARVDGKEVCRGVVTYCLEFEEEQSVG